MSPGQERGGDGREGRVAWALVVAVLLLFAFATASGIVYRLLFGLLAVPLFGYIGGVLASRRIEGTVQLVTSFLQVGETLEEELEVRSLHWWPKLLLEAEHQSKPFGSSGKIVTLWPYRTVTWQVRKHCEQRGVYEFGTIEITVRDPLGLFGRTVQVGSPQTALVYPATLDLPGFFVPAGQGWTEGVSRGRTFMPSPVAATVREYLPGDSMGQIHWPATARTGKLMVKVFEREPSGPFEAVWVLLDLHSDVQTGTGIESTVEYGVTVAASIVKRFIDARRPVGLVIAGEEHTTFRPAIGLTQLGRALEALAIVQPGRAATLSEAAAAIGVEMEPGASVVLVSPAPADVVSAAVRRLEASGAGVVPVLLDASSFVGRAREDGDQDGPPATELGAYVVRRGDEIPQRLDYRVYGTHQGVDMSLLGMLP